MNPLTRASVLAALAVSASAQGYRVNVLLSNVAPRNGSYQTPVWIGFHDGSFDTYDAGALASSLPIPGSSALERLAEDGNTGPLAADFSALGAGRVDATVAGPNGPLAPGDVTSRAFLLDPSDPRDRYFSYASMVIPSNDAFLANGDPVAHPIFDAGGNFVGRDFFVAGPSAVNDAGTELNDEVPSNTAFLAQAAPDTGVTTSVGVATHPGFLPRGSGGILDDDRFRLSNFTLDGYPFLRVGFRAAPAITDTRVYSALALGSFHAPPVTTGAVAVSGAALLEGGARLLVVVQAFGLADLAAAELRLGAAGANGPVVADLLRGNGSASPQFLVAELRSADLAGPLADYPLDALAGRIESGDVYVNLATTANPGGEVRGQLARIQ